MRISEREKGSGNGSCQRCGAIVLVGVRRTTAVRISIDEIADVTCGAAEMPIGA
jgi:hypothetical protein